MKSTIMNKIMKSEVINKTAIFADLFNLNITGFRTKSTVENSNRIELMSDNLLVGYIDITVNELNPNTIETDMPFTLYTPIGKVEGSYSEHFQLFKYEVAKRKDEFEKIEGLFEVSNRSHESKEKYKISSHMTLTKEDGTRTQLISNCLAGNYLVEIYKSNNDKSETARLYLNSGNLCLDHFHYPRFNKREFLSRIKINLDSDEEIHQVNFEFKGEEPYKRNIKLSTEVYLPAFRKTALLDYSDVSEDIDLFDERLGEFIDEVKEDYTILANGITPISIYDKQARLCFHGKKDKFKLEFSRAKEVQTTLESNKVLKKIDNK